MTNPEEETLEPIHPIEETPYGAIIIHNDVLCTPTSLCTWADTKPAVYCRLPPHTRNPVCQEVNKGIGLMGCYEEATCGGMVPPSRTRELLEQNPQYRTVLRTKEWQLEKAQRPASTTTDVLVMTIMGMLSLFLIVLLTKQAYKAYRKRPASIRTPRHSASGRTLSGAGKTVRRVNK